MTKRWSGIIKAATVDLGAAVIVAFMRLRHVQSPERRSTDAEYAPQSPWEKPCRRQEGGFQDTGNPARVKTGRLRLCLAASVLLMFTATLASEVRGNPSISVETEHPPELPLIVEKIMFGPAVGQCSNKVVSALKNHFVDKGLDVLDWQNLDPILAEHEFSFSGYLDRRSTAEMGKILGPSTLIVVKVSRCEIDRQRFTSWKAMKVLGISVQVPAYHAKVLVHLELSVQTADLTTGRIFDAQQVMHSPSLENDSGTIEDPEFPPESEVYDIALAGVVGDVSRMLLPQVERKSLVFFDNKKCNLKAAYQALKNGEEERALDLSLEVLDACKNYPDPKMKQKTLQKLLANAHYNAGVMHRIRGDLESALEYLLEAERLRPVEIMAEAVADCREAIQARDAIQAIREEAQQAALEFRERLAAEDQARRDNTLTNSGVVALVKMGLPEAIIVKKIETSTCEFDVTPEALLSLTKAGVGETVILSMMEIQKSDNVR